VAHGKSNGRCPTIGDNGYTGRVVMCITSTNKSFGHCLHQQATIKNEHCNSDNGNHQE